ncbi:PRTRC system protein C [Pseudomonas guariconensis]|uniref:PRTRC system protein C n=1 Tax=Pseudomonas guariconensis TaxID=1288410 RepID=UPI0039063194
MAAAILTLTRVFRFGGRDLPDPDPSLSVTDVLKHYARQFARLNGGKVVDPIIEADKQIYEFRQGNFGDRG